MNTETLGDLPSEGVPPASSGWIATQLRSLGGMIFTVHGQLHRLLNGMKNESGPDPDEDYGEEDVRGIVRRGRYADPHVRIERYEEGGGKRPTWQNWVSGIVGASLVVMLAWALGKLDSLTRDMATLQATQTMGFGAVAQRQGADEQRIENLEKRVYRGGE